MYAPLSNWSPDRSLAQSWSGQVLEVDEILFSATRDHCWELGIEPGSILTLRGKSDGWVEVDLATGRRARIARHYAWFVSVMPVTGRLTAGADVSMPTYEYRCRKCDKRLRRVARYSDGGAKGPKCPSC